MKHVAAYLLLVVGGNASPSVEEVSSVVTACGGEADSAQIEALIADLEGKNVEELITAGRDKLKSCSAAVGAVAAAAPAAGGAAPAAPAAAPAPKVEEVDALEGGMDMFGGGGGGGDY